jgi:hypothetical protein
MEPANTYLFHFYVESFVFHPTRANIIKSEQALNPTQSKWKTEVLQSIQKSFQELQLAAAINSCAIQQRRRRDFTETQNTRFTRPYRDRRDNEMLVLLLRIREVAGSNFGPRTDCPEIFLWSFLRPPRKPTNRPQINITSPITKNL